jgi:surfactin synthase thioesterase subunit
MQSPWLIRRPGPARRLRLFCLDCAGGNALSYLPWQEHLDPSVEICAIQLPGRGARLAEAPITSMRTLIQALAGAIAPRMDLPFAFFGHSLGALLAFELTRYCQLRYMTLPRRLFVSGCNAPRYRDPPRGLHRLPDEELILELDHYGGTPPELLQHRELMAMVLPAVRADFSLVDAYEYRSSLPLQVPITALAGRHDPHMTPEQALGWASETKGTFHIEWFEGDHFFVHSERDAVLRCIRRDWLQPALASAGQLVQ